MAGFAGDDGVPALLGLDEEFVKQADAFAPAAGAEEKKRGSAAEFGGARPIVFEAMGQGRWDFGDEGKDQIRPLAPVLKAVLERFEVELARFHV